MAVDEDITEEMEEAFIDDQRVSTSDQSSNKATYHQMVQMEHEFEPAEPLPLFAAMVGFPLAILFGMHVGYSKYAEWHEKTIKRLEEQIETLDATYDLLKKILATRKNIPSLSEKLPPLIEKYESIIKSLDESIEFWGKRPRHYDAQQMKVMEKHIINQKQKRDAILKVYEQLKKLQIKCDETVISALQTKVEKIKRSRERELEIYAARTALTQRSD
jgi:hypothetical protein